MSAGKLPTGLATAAAAALATQAVRGLGISMIEVGNTTLLLRWVPRPLRAGLRQPLRGDRDRRGPLLDLTSPRIILVAAGGGGLLATVATALMLLPTLRSNPQQPAPAGDAQEGAA